MRIRISNNTFLNIVDQYLFVLFLIKNKTDVVNGISVPGFFDTVLTQGTTQTVQGMVRTIDVVMEDNVIVSSTVNTLVVEDMWTHSAKITDTEYTSEEG